MIFLRRLSLTIVVFCAFLQRQADASTHLASVFTNEEQRNAIASFIDHVLRQLPSDKVIQMVDAIKAEHAQNSSETLDDAQLYERLRNKIITSKSPLRIIKMLQLVHFQKQLLEKQMKTLLGDLQVVQNCLEIGTPATYASTLQDRIKGKVYVLLDQSSVADVLQAHSLSPQQQFKGYHECIALNDYEPIAQTIADNSIDLIICAIGLHHVPQHKLDAFISSIRRVLRPGGTFILREHNAYSEDLVSLAYAAHSIYNAIIPIETLTAEINEVRNFHALSYWKALLMANGFTVSEQECLQAGDSTLNTLIRCTKQCSTLEDHKLNAAFLAGQHADFSREAVQTYLTTPEWNNVDAAQSYGEYINTVPFYEFPYMAHVKTFWKTFFASWRCAAQEKGGNMKMLLSPNIMLNYTFMNLFVGAFMTIEYSAKAAISLPLRAMISGSEPTTLLALVHDPLDELSSADSSIVVKERYEGNIKLVVMARYVEFFASIKRLMKSSITFIKIANNENILCKIRYKNVDHLVLQPSWVQKFTWQMPTKPDYTYAAYLVPVQELTTFINTVEQSEAQVLYIHDF